MRKGFADDNPPSRTRSGEGARGQRSSSHLRFERRTKSKAEVVPAPTDDALQEESEERALFISVKPRYANAILEGIKTVELRRTRPNLPDGSLVILYSSTPTRAVVGWAHLTGVRAGTPSKSGQVRHRSSNRRTRLRRLLRRCRPGLRPRAGQRRRCFPTHPPRRHPSIGIEPSQSWRSSLSTSRRNRGFSTRLRRMTALRALGGCRCPRLWTGSTVGGPLKTSNDYAALRRRSVGRRRQASVTASLSRPACRGRRGATAVVEYERASTATTFATRRGVCGRCRGCLAWCFSMRAGGRRAADPVPSLCRLGRVRVHQAVGPRLVEVPPAAAGSDAAVSASSVSSSLASAWSSRSSAASAAASDRGRQLPGRGERGRR